MISVLIEKKGYMQILAERRYGYLPVVNDGNSSACK